MKKLIFVMAIVMLLGLVSDLSAWTITTNTATAHSKYRYCFTVISGSSNLTYGSTNWGMPWRFRGRVTPADIFVTMLSNDSVYPAYIRCTVITSKTLNFKVLRFNANAPGYMKANVTIYVPSPGIK